MFCRSDCKSVFKVEPFHWDAVFNWSCTDEHPPQRIKVDDATRTNDKVCLDVHRALRGNFWT